MLNKKDFLKICIDISISDYAPKSDRNIGKHCRHGNAWIREPDCHVGFIACEPVYVYSFLLILWNGNRYFGFMCPVLGKGDKKTVEKILGLAERISLIISLMIFCYLFYYANGNYEDFYKQS